MTNKTEDYSHSINTVVSQRMAAFNAIHIQHPRMQKAHGIFDFLRQLGKEHEKETGGPNNRKKVRHRGIRILGPTGSGKSRAVESYIAGLDPEPDSHIVLHVELQQKATPKRLWVDILQTLGDEFATQGSEEHVKSRARVFLERAKVELIVLDEVQQLVRGKQTASTWNASEALKRMLDDGFAPLVLMGTEEALPLFDMNKQLNGRLLSPFDLNPLDVANDEERDLFKGYCGRLDEQVVRQGCASRKIGLMAPSTVDALYGVSGGVVGVVSRLVGEAMQIAWRRGRTQVFIDDLSLAVDRWAIPGGFCTTNPFLDHPATGWS